jgi:hypothetical protein
MISHAASRSRRSARETPSDRSMRGYRHCSDGKATALRSCPSCSIRGCHAFGTSCVFEAVQVAPTPRIRPREVQRYGGSEARGASKSRASNLKAGIVAYWWACFVRRKFSPHPASSQRYTRVQMLARDFEHRAASAGLFALGGGKPHVPCAYASRRQQQACVWNAACGGTCARYHSSAI